MTKQTTTLMTLAAVGGLVYLASRSRQQPVSGLDGFGSSFKKKFKKAAKVYEKVSPTGRLIKLSRKAAKKVVAKAPGLRKLKLAKKIVGIKTKTAKPKTSSQIQREAAPDTEIEYQDENGNPITKAQYDAKVAEYAVAEQQAQTEESAPAAPTKTPVVAPPSYNRGSPRASFNRGDEELVIRSTESTEYGDNNASQGSPGLPPIQTSVQESEVQYETPVAVEPEPEKKKGGGGLVVGGALAAAAAYLMMK